MPLRPSPPFISNPRSRRRPCSSCRSYEARCRRTAALPHSTETSPMGKLSAPDASPPFPAPASNNLQPVRQPRAKELLSWQNKVRIGAAVTQEFFQSDFSEPTHLCLCFVPESPGFCTTPRTHARTPAMLTAFVLFVAACVVSAWEERCRRGCANEGGLACQRGLEKRSTVSRQGCKTADSCRKVKGEGKGGRARR